MAHPLFDVPNRHICQVWSEQSEKWLDLAAIKEPDNMRCAIAICDAKEFSGKKGLFRIIDTRAKGQVVYGHLF